MIHITSFHNGCSSITTGRFGFSARLHAKQPVKSFYCWLNKKEYLMTSVNSNMYQRVNIYLKTLLKFEIIINVADCFDLFY